MNNFILFESFFSSTILPVILIFIGAVALILAICKTKQILIIIKDTIHLGRWKILLLFMIIFLLGYAFIIVSYIFHLKLYNNILIGLIFLLGAVFVYLVVKMGYNTISELKKTLLSKEEKEVMLQELHHRVKNNMQIIISLMRLQNDKINDVDLKQTFIECENRIQSMALVHQCLYKSKDISTVDLSIYINDLVKYIFSGQSQIKFNLNIEKINLTLDKTIPLGIVINEILTNSLKHAFNNLQNGEVYLSLSKIEKGKHSLIITDNGKGFDTNLNIKSENNSIGLELIKNLIEQIDGEIELTSQIKKGTSFKITF
ncbi:MAG: sensor histidine kinase [Bacteroidetes bacterium]|nr:sensor histidine kinase [Bacteroidota bacterium]